MPIITICAQNDLQKVTAIANQMVTRFGMSDKLGQISYESGGGRLGGELLA